MKKITQRERILRHLQDFKVISSWIAFKDYGITRLSAIIFYLRKKGYNISSEEQVKVKNRYGEKVTFVNYKLIK